MLMQKIKHIQTRADQNISFQFHKNICKTGTGQTKLHNNPYFNSLRLR